MSKKPLQTGAQEEKQIISAVKKGDSERFHEIELRYHEKLFFYLRHLVGSKEEAEDILQDVFLKTFKTLDQFDNRRKFSSWIYRIAHNEAVNFIKRKNKFRSVSWEDIVSTRDRLALADDTRSPQENWIRFERRASVRQALKELPPKYREVLLLRFYFERSYDEIAHIIGKPRNTVGTLISRAKKRLVNLLREI